MQFPPPPSAPGQNAHDILKQAAQTQGALGVVGGNLGALGGLQGTVGTGALGGLQPFQGVPTDRWPQNEELVEMKRKLADPNLDVSCY